MKKLYFLFLISISNSFLFSMEMENVPKKQAWRVDREIQCEQLPTYNLTEPGKPNELLKDRLKFVHFNKQGTEIVAWNLVFPLCFVWNRNNGQLLERIEDATRSNPVFDKPEWKDRIPEPTYPASGYPEGWKKEFRDYDLQQESEVLVLAIKNTENKVCAWDKIKKQETLQLTHDDRVNQARFNRHGIEIVTASKDCTMRLWHSETGKELLRMMYDSSATAASFNEMGTEIVVATEDGKIQILVQEISQ